MTTICERNHQYVNLEKHIIVRIKRNYAQPQIATRFATI